MINKKKLLHMLLAGGQGKVIVRINSEQQNQSVSYGENIRSLTSHRQTVQTQELTQSEF